MIFNKRGQFSVRTPGSRNDGGWLKFVLMIAGIAAIAFFSWNFVSDKYGDKISSSLNGNSVGNENSDSREVVDSNVDAATFTFSVINAANKDAVVTAGIPVGAVNQQGKERLSPSTYKTNHTITTISEREVLDFYGGDSSYYLEPLTERQVLVTDLVQLTARSIQTEANMVVTMYDDTGSTALSAGNSSQAEDYILSLGAGQSKVVYIKLSNNAANADFKAKAICVGWTGSNTSSMEIQGGDWSEGTLPDVVGDTGVTYYSGATSNTDGEYKDCYVYKKGTDNALLLNEWEDSPLIKAVIAAKDSKNPNADGGDNVFFTILDGAWARGSDGKGYFDFYQHDGAEGNVGLSETLSSPTGKQLGALVELQ